MRLPPNIARGLPRRDSELPNQSWAHKSPSDGGIEVIARWKGDKQLHRGLAYALHYTDKPEQAEAMGFQVEEWREGVIAVVEFDNPQSEEVVSQHCTKEDILDYDTSEKIFGKIGFQSALSDKQKVEEQSVVLAPLTSAAQNLVIGTVKTIIFASESVAAADELRVELLSGNKVLKLGRDQVQLVKGTSPFRIEIKKNGGEPKGIFPSTGKAPKKGQNKKLDETVITPDAGSKSGKGHEEPDTVLSNPELQEALQNLLWSGHGGNILQARKGDNTIVSYQGISRPFSYAEEYIDKTNFVDTLPTRRLQAIRIKASIIVQHESAKANAAREVQSNNRIAELEEQIAELKEANAYNKKRIAELEENCNRQSTSEGSHASKRVKVNAGFAVSAAQQQAPSVSQQAGAITTLTQAQPPVFSARIPRPLPDDDYFDPKLGCQFIEVDFRQDLQDTIQSLENCSSSIGHFQQCFPTTADADQAIIKYKRHYANLVRDGNAEKAKALLETDAKTTKTQVCLRQRQYSFKWDVEAFEETTDTCEKYLNEAIAIYCGLYGKQYEEEKV